MTRPLERSSAVTRPVAVSPVSDPRPATAMSDYLPLIYFAVMLIAGGAGNAVLGIAVAGSWSPPAISDPALKLIWLSAVAAPFVLYERYALLPAKADAGTQSRRFYARMLMLIMLIGCLAFSGGWMGLLMLPHTLTGLIAGLLASSLIRHRIVGLDREQWQARGAIEHRIVIGTGAAADRYADDLAARGQRFDRFDERGASLDHQGSIESHLSTLAVTPTAFVIVASAAWPWNGLLTMIERLRPFRQPIELWSGLYRPGVVQATHRLGDRMPLMVLSNRPIGRWDHVIKTALDLSVGLLVTLLLLPLLLGVALLIRLDSPGPVLFVQRRHGFDNAEFDIYKFRTMRLPSTSDNGALKQTARSDPRVTSIGRVLRKWSLDELPQLLNVLNGSMSLVGPRPHAVNMRTQQRLGQEITDAYCHRHRVKPGITGWSQVNGSRGATDTVEQLRRRIELDLYYVDHWSLILDIRILLATFRAVIRTADVY
ncbi:exopolysaccharide biosynthesis polyprenyl glycosylphosphotransferase [Hydrocarboniphaga daqingensis]|uniref:Exopolysaccharide biosynthesis polyprenyl glycosylphosphotransferase n=1 Tax=Hydrocarboniphaga daqingensis TaxID=490188 RepID=A0A1M5PC27_9GAMM|nr:exopolysaccharide biosynthesis polyprenyl glycosylphosphotransferase [Hydrocarboniphaga daqingensis]